MKKIISLLLACILTLSLCACSGSSDAPDAEKKQPTLATKTRISKTLALGETEDVGFAKFSFHSAVIDQKIGGSKRYIVPVEGMQYFCLLGTVQNTSGAELPVSSVGGTMTFNNTYSYSAKGAVIYGDSHDEALPALMDGTFVIYAAVPDALVEQLSDCTVSFSFNEQFDPAPTKEEPGKYNYEIYLNQDVCAAAKNGPVFEMQYFEECPILPNPASFADVRQDSRSASYTNNKATEIKYSYRTNPGSRDDISFVYDKYLAGLKDAGFTIERDHKTDHIYSGPEKLATAELQISSIYISLVPGNENLTEKSQIPEEGFSGEQEIPLGTPIANDYVNLLLDKTGSATELRSGTGSAGTYFRYTSKSGDPYFYLSGVFKNLGSKPVDTWNVYITFTFDDKYTYPGDMSGFVANTGFFVDDVSPLSSVNCYVFAEVPKEVINTYKTCKVRIGFTRDFGYTHVDGNGIPLFKYCDDVYNILITR